MSTQHGRNFRQKRNQSVKLAHHIFEQSTETFKKYDFRKYVGHKSLKTDNIVKIRTNSKNPIISNKEKVTNIKNSYKLLRQRNLFILVNTHQIEIRSLGTRLEELWFDKTEINRRILGLSEDREMIKQQKLLVIDNEIDDIYRILRRYICCRCYARNEITWLSLKKEFKKMMCNFCYLQNHYNIGKYFLI